MTRQVKSLLSFALTIALAMGIALSSIAQSVSHDPAKVAEILVQHQTDIDDHGHAHDDGVDVDHAYQSHSHEMVDHDHNTAFLPPRRSTEYFAPARAKWLLTGIAASGRTAFDLDRPPRV